MYEGITISPVFAHFFLGFLRGKYNWLSMFNDLETLVCWPLVGFFKLLRDVLVCLI